MSDTPQPEEDSTAAMRAVFLLWLCCPCLLTVVSSVQIAHRALDLQIFSASAGICAFAVPVMTHFLGMVSWLMLAAFSSHSRRRLEFWFLLPYFALVWPATRYYPGLVPATLTLGVLPFLAMALWRRLRSRAP